MAKYDLINKPLPEKIQKKLIQQACDIIRRYKLHWDPFYTGEFRNYRKIAAGKLPDDIEARLGLEKYKGKAKLVPRLVADHVEDKTSSLMNSTVNKTEPFKFAGLSEGDADNAENARKVVMYNWNYRFIDGSNAKMEMRRTIRDANIVGGGWLERYHYIDRRLKRLPGGNASYSRSSFDEVYIGSRFRYIKAEMMYPEPYPAGLSFEGITSFVKFIVVPISSIKKETVRAGLYNRFKANVANIGREDYVPNTESQNSISGDHQGGQTDAVEPDYKVLIAEWWTSNLDIYGNDLPVWHVTTIANWEKNPQLLRCDIDPMGNGRHNVYFCRIFDYAEPRLYGTSLVEMLYTAFLEAFHKRNQRINLINMASKRSGMLMGPRSAFPADFIEANSDKLVFANITGKELVLVPTDLSAYTHMLNEELKIENDAQRTAATNPVTMGLSPERRETATTTATIDQRAKERTLDPVGMVEQSLICPAAEDTHEHNLILVPEPYIGRVLGNDRKPHFFKFSRRDILGRFDAICFGSSEIIPKAVKMANAISMVQTFASLPVQVDYARVIKELWQMSEFPGADDVVISPTIIQAEIERENGMLSNGVIIYPLDHESHQQHIGGHQQYMALMVNQMKISPKDPRFSAFMMHIQMHLQLMAEKQGALAQSVSRGTFEDMGQLSNDISSDNMARVGMNG